MTNSPAAFSTRFQVTKTDDDAQLVFGWQYVCRDPHNLVVDKSRTTDDGTVVDWSGEVVGVDDLEPAVYAFVEESRVGKAEHSGDQIAVLIESIVFTPAKKAALGLTDRDVPDGCFQGFHVVDKAVWARVKSGELSMLSFGGSAVREDF